MSGPVVRVAQVLAALAALDLAVRGWRACARGYQWWQDNVSSHNCEEI